MRGEVDYLRGVSENIFLGLLPPMGTGVFDIFFEKKKHRGFLESKIPRCALQDSQNPKNPLSGINRILHLANLMAPTTTSKNFSTKMFLLKNNPDENSENGIPGATTCVEICSQMNEFFPARLSGMFRPTSPVPFEECIAEGVFHSNEVDSCCFQSNELTTVNNNENALMEKLFREHDIMSIYNAIPPSFFQ